MPRISSVGKLILELGDISRRLPLRSGSEEIRDTKHYWKAQCFADIRSRCIWFGGKTLTSKMHTKKIIYTRSLYEDLEKIKQFSWVIYLLFR